MGSPRPDRPTTRPPEQQIWKVEPGCWCVVPHPRPCRRIGRGVATEIFSKRVVWWSGGRPVGRGRAVATEIFSKRVVWWSGGRGWSAASEPADDRGGTRRGAQSTPVLQTIQYTRGNSHLRHVTELPGGRSARRLGLAEGGTLATLCPATAAAAAPRCGAIAGASRGCCKSSARWSRPRHALGPARERTSRIRGGIARRHSRRSTPHRPSPEARAPRRPPARDGHAASAWRAPRRRGAETMATARRAVA